MCFFARLYTFACVVCSLYGIQYTTCNTEERCFLLGGLNYEQWRKNNNPGSTEYPPLKLTASLPLKMIWVEVWNIFIFIPIWGNDPIWLIFFRWVVQPPTRWWFASPESPNLQGAPIFRGNMLVSGWVNCLGLQRPLASLEPKKTGSGLDQKLTVGRHHCWAVFSSDKFWGKGWLLSHGFRYTWAVAWKLNTRNMTFKTGTDSFIYL